MLGSNKKRTKLTIEKDGVKITLKKREILTLVVTSLDLFGWDWLKDKLESYAIYVSM